MGEVYLIYATNIHNGNSQLICAFSTSMAASRYLEAVEKKNSDYVFWSERLDVYRDIKEVLD